MDRGFRYPQREFLFGGENWSITFRICAEEMGDASRAHDTVEQVFGSNESGA